MRADEVPTILEDVQILGRWRLRHYTDHTWEILNPEGLPEKQGSCDMTQDQFLESLMIRENKGKQP